MSRLRSIINYLIAGMLLTSLLGSCSSDRSLQDIRSRKEIKFGLDPSFPPFEMLTPEGELIGFDIELGQMIAGRIGVDASFHVIGFDGLYDALELGQVDLLLSALVVEPSRMDQAAYGIGYYDAGLALVSGLSSDKLEWDRLKNTCVAVEYATEAEVLARRLQRRSEGITVVAHTTPEQALNTVVSLECDTALIDTVSLRSLSKESGVELRMEEMVTAEPFSIVARRNDQALLTAVNSALVAMREDGALERLATEWIGPLKTHSQGG
ncbi:MAG: transporter substrate-binding domain-containing protein [Chloroflexota bacterium]